MSVKVATEKTLRFDASRTSVWNAIADVDSYRAWWPWLETFDAQPLAPGAVWRCRVKPPLPYTVSFAIAFDEVVTERAIAVTVSGEIAGPATLTLSDDGDACAVVVRSSLEPRSGFLRILANTLPPVARYGHDWIIGTGATQFEKRALG
ncbi:MAG: hypothetical protein QOF21_2499 [Actinomycetota bacterium]|jgi:uncharacterized protein YndB with AHSA1/START domain